MRFVVLVSKPVSRYFDTPTSYEYPAQYRKHFAPLERGEPMLAIVYEPLANGRGRKAYVGWAALREPPRRSPRLGVRGEPLWVVSYVDRTHEFPTPVPRDIAGGPIESWLRDIRPEDRNVRTSGASVRPIREAEGRLIVQLGHAVDLAPDGMDPYADLSNHDPAAAAERGRRLVTALERRAGFRDDVMVAYDYTCAISGFGVGRLPLGRSTQLIEAAHIRPASRNGPDVVANGIALTPTLHRLFDEGLFTLRRVDQEIGIVTSADLEPSMIESPDGLFRLPLRTGLLVRLPAADHLRPSPELIRFHQHAVFRGSESRLASSEQ